jgi:septum formation protein
MSLKRFILASASPRRSELLRKLEIDFEVYPPTDAEAPPKPDELPELYAQRMALDKALWVQKRFADQPVWIIAADTIVVLDQEVLGKPQSPEQAAQMLNRLSGRQHLVYTGFALVHKHKDIEHIEVCTTKVWFRKLSPTLINRYIDSGEPMDKAGAYGIQGRGAILVERVDGCYFNVVGLPISRLIAALEQYEAEIWP